MHVRRLRILLLLLTGACADGANTVTAPQRSLSPSSSDGERTEAGAYAHIDLNIQRASIAAAAEALSDAIQSQGVAAGLGAAFASDVYFLTPRTPVLVGATAATNFLSTSVNAPTVMDWDVLRVDASSDGTNGYSMTKGHVALGPGGTVLDALFVLYWRRDAANEWRVAALAYNAAGPGPQVMPAGFGTPTTSHRRY